MQKQIVISRESIIYKSNGLIKLKPIKLKDLPENLFDVDMDAMYQDLSTKYSVIEVGSLENVTEGFQFRPHGHPYHNLKNSGFNDEEIQNMSLTEAIIFDTVIFNVCSWAGHLEACQPFFETENLVQLANVKVQVDVFSKELAEKTKEMLVQHMGIKKAGIPQQQEEEIIVKKQAEASSSLDIGDHIQ